MFACLIAAVWSSRVNGGSSAESAVLQVETANERIDQTTLLGNEHPREPSTETSSRTQADAGDGCRISPR